MTAQVPARRLAVVLTTAVAAVLVIASAAPIWPLRLVYNASASVPLGWYAVSGDRDVSVGDLVAARLPPAAEHLLVSRGYLGVGVPVLKVVSGRKGQRVCRYRDAVTVDGGPAAYARKRDGAGRLLPRWSGCRVLRAGEMFLLNPAPDSFDSRYFGAISTTRIIGRATPLWTW
jgi:conjugative transfer signal peptidase TraF